MNIKDALRNVLTPVAIEQQPTDDEVYTDIDAVPLDDPPEVMGDDTLLVDGKPLAGDTGNGLKVARLKAAGAKPKASQGPKKLEKVATPPARALPKRRIVPFVRELKMGMTGNDVVALKRALTHAGIRKPARATPLFGPFLKRDLKRYQRSRGLAPDGVYGRATHSKLAPQYDNYGVWLLLHTHPKPNPTPGDVYRRKAVAAAILGYNNRWSIHYTQGPLRMSGVNERLKPPRFPHYADCSAYVTWCYYAAGAPDPNGLGYNGQGYTGTLCLRGQRVSTARPGDLCFYGSGAPYHHVTIAISATRCISHGSEGDPSLVDIHFWNIYNETRSYL